MTQTKRDPADPTRANIFLDEVSTLKFFLDIYVFRIIKNTWLLWKLFAARDIRFSSAVATKNKDLADHGVRVFHSTYAVAIIKVGCFYRSNGVTSTVRASRECQYLMFCA